MAKEIDDRKGARFSQYREEFEYLLSPGIALGVDAISNPKFPLVESLVKNLVKLYMNDVGMLTNLLFRYNVAPVLNDERSVNLGSVYESVVAQEPTGSWSQTVLLRQPQGWRSGFYNQ